MTPESGRPSRTSAWTPLVAIGLACLMGAVFFVLTFGPGSARGPDSTGSALLSLESTPAPTPTPTPTPARTPPPAPTACTFQLANHAYGSSQLATGQSVESDPYRAVWTTDGRLWQPDLSKVNQRESFTGAIEIPVGTYTFNGISAALHLDLDRNGLGARNPIAASHVNGQRFSVSTSDGTPAWALVEGDGGASAGFEIVMSPKPCQ
jgi:hypothetical protein